MSFPLYYNNGSYLLIVQKGTAWNIIMEYGSFNTRCIGNEDINNMLEIELNAENIKLLFSTNKNLANIDLTNFDEHHYFYYKNNIYYINDWRNIFKFANGKLV
jgi:hypothetical protein